MPNTRITDPATSFDAAMSIKTENISKTMKGILEILGNGPRHDEALEQTYNALSINKIYPYASPSGIRSRRSELVELGLVEDSGERVKTRSGRSSIVWRIANA